MAVREDDQRQIHYVLTPAHSISETVAKHDSSWRSEAMERGQSQESTEAHRQTDRQTDRQRARGGETEAEVEAAAEAQRASERAGGARACVYGGEEKRPRQRAGAYHPRIFFIHPQKRPSLHPSALRLQHADIATPHNSLDKQRRSATERASERARKSEFTWSKSSLASVSLSPATSLACSIHQLRATAAYPPALAATITFRSGDRPS